MTNIHIKLDYGESLSAKKDILTSEKDLLELISHIKTFSLLRKRKFSLKNQMKKDLVTIRNTLIKIESELPKNEELELPIEKQKKEQLPNKISKTKSKSSKETKTKKTSIEDQIQEIQEKLARLG